MQNHLVLDWITCNMTKYLGEAQVGRQEEFVGQQFSLGKPWKPPIPMMSVVAFWGHLFRMMLSMVDLLFWRLYFCVNV